MFMIKIRNILKISGAVCLFVLIIYFWHDGNFSYHVISENDLFGKINKDLEFGAEVVNFDIPSKMFPGEMYAASITFKNTGTKSWTRKDLYKLTVDDDFNSFTSGGIGIYSDDSVEKGEEYKFNFLFRAPYVERSFSGRFQMKKGGVYKFGDVLEGKIDVDNEYKNDNDFIKLDEFDMILSDDDIKYFDYFVQESNASGYKREDLNNWRDANLRYNGENYDVKIRIHGNFGPHFKNPIKSYQIRLMDDKQIKGFRNFSFIIFADRLYYPLLKSVFYNFLNLKGFYYEIVRVALNDSGYVSYYFRGAKDEDFAEINEMSNTSLIYNYLIGDPLKNVFFRMNSGVHYTFLDYEFGFDKVKGDGISPNKVNYAMYLLRNFRFDEEKLNLDFLDFFDYNYLINYEALRTLTFDQHDSIGDNMVMAYNGTSAKFYPLISGEYARGYPSNLVEAYVNRGPCSAKNMKYVPTDFIFPFYVLNGIDDFRQDKYRKIFEIIEDGNIFNRFLRTLSLYNNLQQDEDPLFSSDECLMDEECRLMVAKSILKNISIIRNELLFSKLVVLFNNYGKQVNLKINPISISELKINNFKLGFDNNFISGDVINFKIKHYDHEDYKKVVIEKNTNTIEIPYDLLNSSLSLGLDDDYFPVLREKEIIVYLPIKNSLKNVLIIAENNVTGAILDANAIPIVNDSKKYENIVNKFFNYKQPTTMDCQGKAYHDLSGFDWSLVSNKERLQLQYLDLWAFVNSEKVVVKNLITKFGNVLFTLQNYESKLKDKDLINIIMHDLSYVAVYLNVIQKANIIEIELMPISLSALNFEKVILNLNNNLLKGQKIVSEIKDMDGKVLFFDKIVLTEDSNVIDISPLFKKFKFNSNLDDKLKVEKTKYYVRIEFIGLNKEISIESMSLNCKNLVTNQQVLSENVVYAVADGNQYYWDEKFFTPYETKVRYGIFDLVSDKLVLNGNIYVNEDIIIPKNTKLIIRPGTKIFMAPKTSIVSYSPVIAEGTEQLPIEVKAYDLNSPFGVFALANEGASGSSFKYFNIENGNESTINGVYFSGMFSAYHNDNVIIENSTFKGSYSDDGLNFKYSNSVIRNSYFVDNSGDAIDFDFMTGEISGSVFDGNGNDAIDVSGSSTFIKDNYVKSSGDKCISVGEKSTPLIFNNLLTNCKIGIEVKDLSKPIILNDVIIGNKMGINSYQKKEIFGGGHAKVYNVLLFNNDQEITFKNTFKGNKMKTDDSDIEIDYSNIPGGYDGNGNIDEKISDGQICIDNEGDFSILKKYIPDYKGPCKVGILYR